MILLNRSWRHKEEKKAVSGRILRFFIKRVILEEKKNNSYFTLD